MTRFHLRPTHAVSALLVAAGTLVAEAHGMAGARGESPAQHDKETTARTRDAVPKHEIYFRPFCRRSRYVTNRAAPCW